MKKLELGVDAGVIAVLDLSVIEKYDGILNNSKVELGLPGLYEFKVKIPNCWLGSVTEKFSLNSVTGVVYVGDPCYSISDEEWERFLNDTNYMADHCAGAHFISTGGDGKFDVEVSCRKV